MTKNEWFVNIMIAIILGFCIFLAFKPTASEDPNSVQLLYVQNAHSGTLQEMEGDSYKLTLNGVSLQTIFFSDRPNRISGQIATEAFVSDDIFQDKNDPPNAALEIFDAELSEDVIVLELFNPVYDPASKQMLYDVKILSYTKSDLLKDFSFRADSAIPKSFDSAALFIDSGTIDTSPCYNPSPCNLDHSCPDPLQACYLVKGQYRCEDDIPY